MTKMHRYPYLAAVLGAGMLLHSGAPAAGSQDHHTQLQWVNGDRVVRVEGFGEVEFTGDDTDVLRIAPGGRLSVEERREGRPTYQVEFAPAGGELRRTYFVDGRRREPDAATRAWQARILPEVARESAIGAKRRLERLVAGHGVAGALREIGRTRSDGAKRTYYSLLLRRHGLDPESIARVLEASGRTIGSDGDRSSLLASLAPVLPLQSEAVRRAYFSATAGIGSNGDKAAVLLSVPPGLLVEDAVRRSYLDVAGTLRSGGDRARVLAYLADPRAPGRGSP